MEPIEISLAEFIEKVARPRGMLDHDIERQCSAALAANTSWSIVVGPKADLYAFKPEAIKAYLDAKAAKLARVDEEELVDAFVFETDEPQTKAVKSGGSKK